MFWLLLWMLFSSVSVHRQKFLCFLVTSVIWMATRVQRAKELHLHGRFYSVPHVTIWSNKNACIWVGKAPNTGRQWAKVFPVASCPTNGVAPLSHCLLFSLLGSSPHLSVAEFRMGLHFPGHLGWWSPLPQGLGRPLGLLLEDNMGNTCTEIVYIIKFRVVSLQQEHINFRLQAWKKWKS